MIKMSSVFTEIIEGRIPCDLVYENESVIAFLDINPASRGHTLLVPKEPAETIDQLSIESAAELGAAIPKVCRGVMEATGAVAYNLLQNNGREAGMTVPHVHIHIIPRYPQSSHSFIWSHGTLDQSEAIELARRIKDSIKD